MVAAAVRIGCPDDLVVSADASANDVESIVVGVMREIPKGHDQMGVMRPASFGKSAGLEVSDKAFDVLSGRQHRLAITRRARKLVMVLRPGALISGH